MYIIIQHILLNSRIMYTIYYSFNFYVSCTYLQWNPTQLCHINTYKKYLLTLKHFFNSTSHAVCKNMLYV